MGAALGGVRKSGGKGKFSRRGAVAPLSEINITPLVDVMLVLLIIFMVAAPMMTAGINVNLPKAAAKPLPNDNQQTVTISIDKDSAIYVDKIPVNVDSLEMALKSLNLKESPDLVKVILKSDRVVDYGKVMQVMSKLNAFGFRKISLLSEQGNN